MHLFSIPHYFALAILVIFSIAMYYMSHCALGHRVHTALRYSLLFILITNEAAWFLIRHFSFGIPIKDNLPLHLCDLAVFIAVLGLLFPQQRLICGLSYYLGISGTFLAILFPTISEVGFWREIAIARFFITHIIVFGVGVYLTFGRRFYPRRHAPRHAFFVFLIFMGLVAIVNGVLDTNYMFLSQRPFSASFLKSLSQPVYLMATVPFAFGFIYLLHIPFIFSNSKKM